MNSLLSSIFKLQLVAFTYGVSADCADVVNLAMAMNLDKKLPSRYSQLTSNCCNDPSITCTGTTTQIVTKIIWSNFNLDGYIDGNSIPPNTIQILLDGNVLIGNFPSLPNGIQYIDFSGNRLVGDMTGLLPSSLTTISIENNKLSGTVSLNRPGYLTMNNNWITDLIITDSSQLTLSICDFSYNPLSGNSRVSNLLSKCVANGLYSASLLPVTLTAAKTTIKTASTLALSKITVQPTSIAKTTTTVIPTTTVPTKSSVKVVTTAIPATTVASSSVGNPKITIITTTSKMTTDLEPLPVRFPSSYSQSFDESTQFALITQPISFPTTHITLAGTTNSLVTHSQNQVQFHFTTNVILRIIFKFMVNCTLLGVAMRKTPFLRELKKRFTNVNAAATVKWTTKNEKDFFDS